MRGVKKLVVRKVEVPERKYRTYLYWHEYRVTLPDKPDRVYQAFSTLSPFFDDEWQNFLALMKALDVKVEVIEEYDDE